MGLSEGALKVAVHRLRRRFGELVREEIAQTVGTAEDVGDEVSFLRAVLRE
jgi:RNA polymerase sigma-70 factor (ECF subfamily)